MMKKKTAEQLMIEDAKKSGLNKSDVKKLKLCPLSKNETKKLTGYIARPSYRIPYFNVDGKQTEHYRIKLLGKPSGFEKNNEQKYWSVPNTLPAAYFPIYIKFSDIMNDPERNILITEGEKKAAKGSKDGFDVLALPGVHSWKSNKQNIPLIEDLQNINWNKRTTFFVPDSDVHENRQAMLGVMGLAQRLHMLGTRVYMIKLPKLGEKGKTGLDDYLVQEGPDAFEKLWASKNSCQLLTPSKQLVYLNFPMTDAGNGEVIAHLNSGNLHFQHECTQELYFPDRSLPFFVQLIVVQG